MANRYLTKSKAYPSGIKELSLENLPENDALHGLAQGLAEGHRAYGNPEYVYPFSVENK